MPRKQWTEEARQKAEFGQWRLLVRKPEFLKDLASLQKLRPKPHDRPAEERRKAILRKSRKIQQVENKWGLSRIPPEALLPYLGTEAQSLEHCYLRQSDQRGPYPIATPPVAFLELKNDRFLYGWVDTSQPVDTVLAALEGELRNFYRDRGGKQKRGRPDKLDFQLAVFDYVKDMLEEGYRKEFRTIAADLGKPVSTVRKAYWTACHKIGVLGVQGKSSVSDPGPFDKCPAQTCRAAQKETDLVRAIQLLCPAHQKFYKKSGPSLADLLPRNPLQ